MLKIIVISQSANGKFFAAYAGFTILKYSKRKSTARRDADKMAAKCMSEGHEVEIRDFLD